MSHIFIFLGYSEFPSWLPWQPIQILQYPKSIQQNIKMWDMVHILVIQQPYLLPAVVNYKEPPIHRSYIVPFNCNNSYLYCDLLTSVEFTLIFQHSRTL